VGARGILLGRAAVGRDDAGIAAGTERGADGKCPFIRCPVMTQSSKPPIKMASDFVWGGTSGAVCGLVAGAVFWNHWLLIYVVPAAAIIGYIVGARQASAERVNAVVDWVNEQGGPERLLDRFGREWLTLWIPLNPDNPEADRQSKRALGEQFVQ
jgi:hypothetical protein